ncbi:MAG TPA: nucleotide exchange factor GrpE [Micropepsaceae bacterium]|nr:nucleotide exchange factor GrpE [Micropepsaceae bacterium]
MSDEQNASGNGQHASASSGTGSSDELLKALDEARAEAQRMKDEWLRAVAEGENIRKRGERLLAEERQFGITRFARDLLSVADNLRRAIEAVPADQRTQPTVAGLVTGVELTERELAAVFERNQIKRIAPLGEKFNPHFHQAIAKVPGTGRPHGTIIDVVQTGYVIADRLLRPAMVAVADGDAGAAPPGSSVDTKV